MPTDDRTPVDILLAAKDVVIDGWHKGCLVRGPSENPTSVCAIGAVNYADTGNAEGFFQHSLHGRTNTLAGWKALVLLSSVVRERGFNGQTPYVIANFNDEAKTTKQDVIDAFDEAIRQGKDHG